MMCKNLSKTKCKRRRQLFQVAYRAEWEYAARAGNDTDYSFGNNPKSLPQFAWFGNLGYKGSPHEVAQKDPNEWGL